jgi:hypothetical protein
MGETSIMLSKLNSVKVLVGKDDTHACIGAHVERTIITTFECISADGRCSSTFEFSSIWHLEEQTV